MRPDRVVVVVVLALICGLQSPAAADEALNQTIDRMFRHVNLIRAMNGTGPLKLNKRLTSAAQSHAEDMARRDYVDHRSPDGRALQDRIQSAGYPWRVISENVAAGRSSPIATVDSWMTSAGHRDNMLGRDYRDVGIGYAVPKGDGKRPTYSRYWAIVFGARSR